jgi:hypothetical protein
LIKTIISYGCSKHLHQLKKVNKNREYLRGWWGTVLPPNSRQQTADSRQQTADSRQQTADSRQQTADSRQQTADST